MLSLKKPTAEKAQRFLRAQAKLDFSYRSVGATATKPPAGFVVDHTRIKLGDGAEVFLLARVGLEKWAQFGLGWVEVWPTDTRIRSGEVVAVLARVAGLWWLNACRIIYVVDESGPIQCFGF